MSKERKKKFMKKTMKKLIALVLVFAMLLSCIPAFAAEAAEIYAEDQVSAIKYPNEKMSEIYLAYVSDAKTVKVKTSNSKVGFTVSQKNPGCYSIYLKAKKSGTTKVTIKAGKVTKTMKVTVRNYENPLAAVQVGKTTVSGNKYTKSNELKFSYAKYAGEKIKISFKAKKGWKVKQVEYAEKSFMKSAKSKNGAKFFIRGGNRYDVLAVMEQEGTGETELVFVKFR